MEVGSHHHCALNRCIRIKPTFNCDHTLPVITFSRPPFQKPRSRLVNNNTQGQTSHGREHNEHCDDFFGKQELVIGISINCFNIMSLLNGRSDGRWAIKGGSEGGHAINRNSRRGGGIKFCGAHLRRKRLNRFLFRCLRGLSAFESGKLRRNAAWTSDCQ